MFILSFSIFLAIFSTLVLYLLILLILAFALRLIVGPLRFIYNSLFGVINDI